MNEKKLSLQLSRSKIITTLIYVAIALLILNCLSLYLHYVLGYPSIKGFVPKFDFDEENNVPTYFSSFLLLISAILLFWASISAKQASSKYAKHWGALSIVFLFMSLDETASFHELLIDPLREIFNLSGYFYWSWVVFGLIIVIIFAISYIRFLLDLPPKVRYTIILAAALYLGGVIGMEMISGNYYSVYGQNLIYAVLTTIEETLEIAGLILLIKVLFDYLFVSSPGLEIKLEG